MRFFFASLVIILFQYSCSTEKPVNNIDPRQKHIVFLVGEEEYRSEESMPMMARILERELNVRTTLCFSVDQEGYIDPNRLDHIQGLEAIESADLVVMFLRFRSLPLNELKFITDYVESGKPLVGFRTSTHAFRYKQNGQFSKMNEEWPKNTFGQHWIAHHGHFDDGQIPLTDVRLIENVNHQILSGVEDFQAFSWLYHVDGGLWNLDENCVPILNGNALKSRFINKDTSIYSTTNPVAWLKEVISSDKKSKTFFTTLGHPFDFKNQNMRKLILNAVIWSLDHNPKKEYDLSFVGSYQPNNSGVRNNYNTGLRPENLNK